MGCLEVRWLNCGCPKIRVGWMGAERRRSGRSKSLEGCLEVGRLCGGDRSRSLVGCLEVRWLNCGCPKIRVGWMGVERRKSGRSKSLKRVLEG
jgi:hypothetical protein